VVTFPASEGAAVRISRINAVNALLILVSRSK